MRLTIGELKLAIREAIQSDCWGGSQPDEIYEEELMDDPELAKRSTYVPDDIKHAIKKWTRAMGLSGTKRT